MEKAWILDIETSRDGKTIWICVVRNVATGQVLRIFNRTEFIKFDIENEPDCYIGHSIIDFDKRKLETVWGIGFGEIQFIDTLLLSRLDNPVRSGGHGLDNWGKIVGHPKGNFNDWDNPGPDMFDYCEQDTKVTLAVFQHLLKSNLPQSAIDMEHYLQYCLTETREKGFKLDIEYTKDLLAELKYDLLDITKELQETFPEKVEYVEMKTKLKVVRTPFNPGSRQQVAARLMELGWQPTERTEPSKLHPQGQVKVDEEVLEGVDIPEAKIVQRYFMLQKRVGMLENWLGAVEPDGRVRCLIIGNGTITHRASHSGPNLGQVVGVQSEYGKEFRTCWTVDNDYVLVGVDLKGLEGRIMCHYTQDMVYAQAVMHGNSKDGTDIHTVNMRAFGLTDRAVAKNVYYALMYGAGVKKIARMIGCSPSVASDTIENFYDNLPLLKALKEKVDRVAGKQHWLPGLDGRKTHVRAIHSAVNTLFQSGGAVVSKLWYIMTVNGLKAAGLDATVVMWVHDELQIETRQGQEDQVLSIALEAAVEAGKELGLRLPIEADGKVGKTWYDTH